MWRSCCDYLHARLRLQKKGVLRIDQCVVCEEFVEDINHLFFKCNKSVLVDGVYVYELDSKIVVDDVYGGTNGVSNYNVLINYCRHMLTSDLATSNVRFI